MEAAINSWIDVMDVGPFVLFQEGAGSNYTYRGRPTGTKFALAFSYLGDTQIELICPLNGEPSVHLDFLLQGGKGLQHVAFWTDRLEETRAILKSAGSDEIFISRAPNTHKETVYLTDPGFIGAMVEVRELSPRNKRIFETVKKLCDEWDGSTRVVRYRSMSDFPSE